MAQSLVLSHGDQIFLARMLVNEAEDECQHDRTPLFDRVSHETGSRVRDRQSMRGEACQQPRQMFFIAASVRAFSALSGSAYFSCCDAGVLDVAALSGAVGGEILS